MIYPKWLNYKDKIGVCALSAGVGKYLDAYLKSIKNLEKEFSIVETDSVRNNSYIANTGVARALEFNSLVKDDSIDMIMCATGGDFAIETLPYIDYDAVRNNPKLIMGASDPTSILYIITTKYDIATIYGLNACSYDQDNLHKSLTNNLEILKGNLIVQDSFPLYEKEKSSKGSEYNLTEKDYWECLNGDVDIKGRIIGGCVDVLSDIIGTKYDETRSFVERYSTDGFIWYFDVFSLSSEEFYRKLFQMQEAGWFYNVKGILVGRVMYPSNSFDDFDYKDALNKIFGPIPIIYNCDIGHVAPKMTIINGSIASVKCSDGKGQISFELE